MAGWIKVPLGTEVRLGPGSIVLDGDPAPSSPTERGTAASPFSAHVYRGFVAKRSPISAMVRSCTSLANDCRALSHEYFRKCAIFLKDFQFHFRPSHTENILFERKINYYFRHLVTALCYQ